MEQSKFLEEVSVWDHPPQSRITQTEEKNKKFFKENQTDSLRQPHIKMTQHRTMRNLKVISGPSRETSFIAITWNPESNCTCREKKHFCIPLKYIDVTRNTRTSLWCNAGEEDWWLLERGWRSWIVRYVDRIHKIYDIERETTRWVYVVETDEKANDFQAGWMIARNREKHVWCIQT